MKKITSHKKHMKEPHFTLFELLKKTILLLKKNFWPIMTIEAIFFAFAFTGGLKLGKYIPNSVQTYPNSYNPFNSGTSLKVSEINSTKVLTIIIAITSALILLQIIKYGSLTFAAIQSTKGKKVEVWHCIQISIKKLGKVMKALIRIILYAGGWFLLAMLLFVFINRTEFGIRGTLTLFIANVILAIGAGIGFAILIYRSIRVIFIWAPLMELEKTPKETVKWCLKITKGKWLRIAGYTLIASFLLTFIVFVYTGITVSTVSSAPANFQKFLGFVFLLPYLVLDPLSALFLYTFYKKLEKC